MSHISFTPGGSLCSIGVQNLMWLYILLFSPRCSCSSILTISSSLNIAMFSFWTPGKNRCRNQRRCFWRSLKYLCESGICVVIRRRIFLVGSPAYGRVRRGVYFLIFVRTVPTLVHLGRHISIAPTADVCSVGWFGFCIRSVFIFSSKLEFDALTSLTISLFWAFIKQW